MRRFLYFLPGVPGANRQMLADRGLADRFLERGELIEHVVLGVDAGPAGSGCIVAAGPNQPTYAPDRQQWLEGVKFWCAVEDFPPRPQDLAREVGISGYETPLGDGAAWRVPLIRRWDRRRLEHLPNLPQSMRPSVVSGSYKYASHVRPEYAAVNGRAERIMEAFAAEKVIDGDQAFADAAALLAVNYRIGAEECGLLGLMDQEMVVRVLGLAVDAPALRQQAEEFATDGLQFSTPVIEEE